MTDRDDEYSSVKYPVFNGKKKNWRIYKTKMLSYLAQKGCVELLRWTTEVPKDNEDLSAATATAQERLKIRKQNAKAAGILLNSIDAEDNEKGEFAFFKVEKYVDSSDGYAAGNFKKAWEDLEKYYEHKDEVTATDYEREYFKYEMKDDDYPPTFIMKLDRMRTLMNKNIEEGREVNDDTFIKHVLSKLPRNDDPKVLGPYQVKRSIIEGKLSGVYDIEDLTLDLTKTYEAIYGAKDLDDDDEESPTKKEGEVGLPAYGQQPKKKCHKCGKWGHIARFCRSGSSSGKSGGSGGAYSGNQQSNPHQNLQCGYCKKVGHIKKNCFKLQNKQKYERGGSNDTGEIALICHEILIYQAQEKDEEYSVDDSFFDSFETFSDLENMDDSLQDSDDEENTINGNNGNSGYQALKYKDLNKDEKMFLKQFLPHEDCIKWEAFNEETRAMMRKLFVEKDSEERTVNTWDRNVDHDTYPSSGPSTSESKPHKSEMKKVPTKSRVNNQQSKQKSKSSYGKSRQNKSSSKCAKKMSKQQSFHENMNGIMKPYLESIEKQERVSGRTKKDGNYFKALVLDHEDTEMTVKLDLLLKVPTNRSIIKNK